jgi:hypothetical protein
MSDNLLLTVLGAVGVGALIMGMTQKEQIKEDWNLPGMTQNSQTISFNKETGKISTVNFADNALFKSSLQTIQQMEREGVPQSQQIAQLSARSNAAAARQMASLQSSIASMNPPSVENYSPPLQLGSGQVTRNDYVSYPQFNQNVPLQSPSLNLPAEIRYNPPSLNNMGITNAYQNNPMDYAALVEGYAKTDFQNPNPGQDPKNTNFNKPNGFISNEASWKKAFDKGNSSKDKDVVQGDLLPLSTMDSGAVDAQDGQISTVNYDRFIYAPLRPGWRQQSSGVSDLIRGDLAVCVDPCQKGWFQSSLQPANLRAGSLAVIGGGSGNNSEVTSKFASIYGSSLASTSLPPTPLTTLAKASLGTTSNTVSTVSFA